MVEQINQDSELKPMKIIVVSRDKTLIKDGNYKVPGNALSRTILYSKEFTHVFNITNGPDIGSQEINPNLSIFSVSGGYLTFIVKSYFIASKIISKNQIDAIITQDPLLTGIIGILLKYRFKIPVIVSLHGDYLNNKFWLDEGIINYFYNFIGNFITKHADGLRVVSQRIKEKMIIWGYPKDKIFVFPVMVELNKFQFESKNNPIKQKYNMFKDIVLFVGRLVKQKNIDNLISAADIVLKQYPNVVFLIIGTGEEQDRLKSRVCSLHLEKNFKFEGFIDNETLLLYYNACDIFVLPSNYEGRATVLVEAMSAGKAVISTDISGAKDVIIHGWNGYIVQDNDSRELAEKILTLLQNPVLRTEMGLNGKGICQKNDISQNSYLLREMTDSLIKK
jgi:glycosyltransferase involved in cell wall biosynthesis